MPVVAESVAIADAISKSSKFFGKVEKDDKAFYLKITQSGDGFLLEREDDGARNRQFACQYPEGITQEWSEASDQISLFSEEMEGRGTPAFITETFKNITQVANTVALCPSSITQALTSLAGPSMVASIDPHEDDSQLSWSLLRIHGDTTYLLYSKNDDINVAPEIKQAFGDNVSTEFVKASFSLCEIERNMESIFCLKTAASQKKENELGYISKDGGFGCVVEYKGEVEGQTGKVFVEQGAIALIASLLQDDSTPEVRIENGHIQIFSETQFKAVGGKGFVGAKAAVITEEPYDWDVLEKQDRWLKYTFPSAFAHILAQRIKAFTGDGGGDKIMEMKSSTVADLIEVRGIGPTGGRGEENLPCLNVSKGTPKDESNEGMLEIWMVDATNFASVMNIIVGEATMECGDEYTHIKITGKNKIGVDMTFYIGNSGKY